MKAKLRAAIDLASCLKFAQDAGCYFTFAELQAELNQHSQEVLAQ